MTTAAALGAFGWVGQSAHDVANAASSYNVNNMTWHKAIAGQMSLVQLQNPYEYEVGGSILPPGTYKGGVWSAGPLTIQPRLAYATGAANGLAPLFWAYAGDRAFLPASTAIASTTLASTTFGTTVGSLAWPMIGPASADGVLIFPGSSTTAQFGVDTGDGDDKWLTVRKVTPGSTKIGETFYNCKVAGITISVAPGAPVRMDVAFMGGAGDSDTLGQANLVAGTDVIATNGWNYGTANDVSTIPLGCNGFVKVGVASSTALDNVQTLQISLGSNYTQPQQMLVVGQYSPYDYAMLSRPIGITYTHLWENADLYRQIYYGGSTGTAWSPTPYTSSFWFKSQDPTSAYKMGFFAQTVDWMSKPVGLAGESIVVMEVNGMVRDTTTADWGLWLAHSGLSGASAWAT